MQFKTGLGLTAALMVLGALPSAVLGADESLIPPGNSAVNQYTESFPTSGGDKDSEAGAKRSPDKVLGPRRARQLERLGRDGRAAAEVAAETAPAPIPGSPDGAGSDDAEGSQHGGSASTGGSGDQGGGADPQVAQTTPGAPGKASAIQASGSSGIVEVLGGALGSTSPGETGLLLPLTILAALIWAVAFFIRRRKGEAVGN
ncbi:MAG: hypothetical protein WDZ46_08025 [Solirubrobacterales bacterium]